jgi:transposase
MLERIEGELGDVCGDKAYASRDNAQYVEDRGGTPFFMPKENATTLSKGHPGWRRMVLHKKKRPESFDKRYHKRSNGEAVNSSFKRKLGAYLRSRKWWNQRRETALKVIAYNIRLLIRFRIRNGINQGGC